ncbi:hypothetical protein R0J90_20625, partial [Micrococcus sp. SIMBA_144]
GTPITVYTWIKRIGRTSFEVYEEIHQNESICVKGSATYVNYHFDVQKSMPIPDEIRSQLEDHLYGNQKATSE